MPSSLLAVLTLLPSASRILCRARSAVSQSALAARSAVPWAAHFATQAGPPHTYLRTSPQLLCVQPCQIRNSIVATTHLYTDGVTNSIQQRPNWLPLPRRPEARAKKKSPFVVTCASAPASAPRHGRHLILYAALIPMHSIHSRALCLA